MEVTQQKSRKRKIAMSAAIVMGLLALVGVGTFAAFNATTTNAVTFETGTIVLRDEAPTGGACLSTGGVNNSNVCSAVIAADLTRPGDTANGNLTLANVGSLSATLKVAASACSNSDASDETYHGTGNPCGSISVTIQEWDDAAHSNATKCVYGADGGDATCDNTTTYASGNTLNAFATATTSPLSLGSLDGPSGVRYFTVYLTFNPDADNNMQGRTASQTLTFTLS